MFNLSLSMKKLHPTTNIFTPEQRATIKIQSLPETAKLILNLIPMQHDKRN
jgi:hypothetical protein